MPEPNLNDNVLDNVIEIPVEELKEKEQSMADVPANIHEQGLSRISAAGAQGHEHFVQFSKILDLSYESDRKMVSLVESLGVREVTSQSGQKGIPGNAG